LSTKKFKTQNFMRMKHKISMMKTIYKNISTNRKMRISILQLNNFNKWMIIPWAFNKGIWILAIKKINTELEHHHCTMISLKISKKSSQTHNLIREWIYNNLLKKIIGRIKTKMELSFNQDLISFNKVQRLIMTSSSS
jgi:hypothetical protein